MRFGRFEGLTELCVPPLSFVIHVVLLAVESLIQWPQGRSFTSHDTLAAGSLTHLHGNVKHRVKQQRSMRFERQGFQTHCKTTEIYEI